ncbi:MAG: hypothetical protein KDE27_28470, partial [Planctomycetes bacterium]|nr:hypothetical protein [Planctomycetota bacterium]
GLPNAPMGLLVSMLPRAGVAFLGLEVWVEHAIGPRQLTIGNLDASGAVSLWFNLPPNPDLTGMSLYYQYFYVDPSVPAGAGHTAALSGTIGGL